MKAVECKSRTNGIWVLGPARTDTKWFHEWVLPYAEAVYFIKGRLNFDSNTQVKHKNAPFPSMLILYSRIRFDEGAVMSSLEPTPKAYEIWKTFPRGTRSRCIRAVLKDAQAAHDLAELLDHKDRALNIARNKIRRLELSNDELRVFGCQCVVSGVSPKEVSE